MRRVMLGAVVLSGGTATRMDGIDKATIEIGGQTLLERALAALVEVPDVVVVGTQVPTSRPVTFTREDPAGGGPAAGLLAGLRAFPKVPDRVVVLAVDMPRVTAATVRRLMLLAQGDGAVLIDRDGRRQTLCGVYDGARLLAASPGPEAEHGLAVRRLLAPLDLVEVAATGGEARDIDTWADLRDIDTPI